MSDFTNDDLDQTIPVKKWPPGVGLLLAFGVSAILWVFIGKGAVAAWHAVFG